MNKIKEFIEKILERLGLGMRAKLIMLFVVIKIIPLLLIALVAWRQSWLLGEELKVRTTHLAEMANEALKETGEIAVNDAVKALDDRAREDIERMTTDTARAVANFLYSRDDDVKYAATLKPDYAGYRNFIDNQMGVIVKESQWVLSEDNTMWVPTNTPIEQKHIVSSIPDNDKSFHYLPPIEYTLGKTPLYLEMTFVDLTGQEIVKATTSPLMSKELKNISGKENTFIKAEEYYKELLKLKPGEIYVSDVIGEYVGSKIIGSYTPKSAEKAGIPFEPEKSAYAGKENPLGERFQGIVRWATPVVESDKIVGYVTLALNHDHIMEFTSRITSTDERYTELPDASAGNYAFIWDYKGRNIVHPRHFSIAGYNAETGEPQIPWLEDRIYNEWQASGKPFAEFIQNVPTFQDQSNSKLPSLELKKEGLVGLDCRYLNFAPQCTGWFNLTQDGGSGSFQILWSDLWKRNTAAAIPYYTGHYGGSPRGFGFVAIGAGVDDFHKPAIATKEVIDHLIAESDKQLIAAAEETQKSINQNLLNTASSLSVSTGVMAVIVILVAIWLASIITKSLNMLIKGISRFRSGERQFRFNSPIKDEMGLLADSFDDMANSIEDSVKGALAIVDLDQNIIYMNKEGLEFSNKTLPEVVGKPYADYTIYPPESKYSGIASLLAGKEAEMIYHPPDDRYYKSVAKYFYDKNGKVSGYIINTTDVTELALEQKKIEEQRVILGTVFSASPDLIWYKDTDSNYLAVNPRFATLLGKDVEDIIRHNMDGLFSDKPIKELKERDVAVLEGKVPVYSEDEFIFADGHKEIVESVRTPLYGSDGKAVGILGVSRDISKRVTIENELRNTQINLKDAVESANNANKAKSEFLARMSHEIRTPMNAIIGMTNIVKMKLQKGTEDREEIRLHVNQIEISSQHLLGLLNDILDISKIEAGKIELFEETFDLEKMADDVATIIKPRCDEKGIHFAVNIANLENKVFISDPLRLRQVLINLLGNAVKFTQELGKIEFSITQLERDADKSLIQFSVKDNGIGITEEQKAMLFRPFEQGGGHISKNYGGTGLGLSISNKIVNLLGGDITLTSQDGTGSEFQFTIWLKLAEVSFLEEESTDSRLQTEARKILLVDDNAINRIIVKEQLKSTGLTVDEAEDGAEAVERFTASEAGEYGIIFMDIQMPKMDGYQATEAIRALDRDDAKSVPIIALTANAFKDDVDKALSHGMNAHMAKPLEYDKLIKAVNKYIKI